MDNILLSTYILYRRKQCIMYIVTTILDILINTIIFSEYNHFCNVIIIVK